MNSEVLIRFIGDTKDVNSKTNALETSIKGLTKKIALGNLASQAMSKSFNILSSNMDGAISRFDTLNQFPKVMKNLGISSQDAEDTIKLLSDELTGLPTALDSATGSVQRLTSKNGDVKKSAKYFLAMNNAILAGGGNAQTQASAIEQLSQAYAKGKPDMMEWRTMMTAMPAQMKQVAIAMGYVDADELGKALRKGEVSMDKFMDTMVQLNEKGVGQFASFEQQARDATGGISTSFTNMKTAIVRGLANVLTAIDNGLASVGGISGVIQKLTKIINDIFAVVNKYLPPVINWIIQTISGVGKLVKKSKPIQAIIVGITTALVAYKTVMLAVKIATTAWTIAQTALNAVLALNPIAIIIALIVALIAVLIYLWNNCEGFRNFVKGMFEMFKIILEEIFNFVGGIIKGIWGTIKWLWDKLIGFLSFMSGISAKIVGFFLNLPGKMVKIGANIFNSLKKGAVEKWEGFKEWIGGIVEDIKGKFNWIDDFIEIGKNLIEGIKKGVKKAWDGAKNWFGDKANGIKNGFKKAFGIHSPSKVFADEIGSNLGKGIEVGFTATMNKSSKKMLDSFNNAFALSPTLTGTANTHLSPTVNVVVNNNMKTDPLGQVVNTVKTFSGGAKNDYNYGYGG